MLSVILGSRYQGNEDHALIRLLNSLEECGANKKNCEVLIKFDSDEEKYGLLPSQSTLSKLTNFTIKKFVYERGEGRDSLQNDYTYLFSQRNPASKFVLIASDDFVFEKKGFIDQILAIEDEYAIVSHISLCSHEWKPEFFRSQHLLCHSPQEKSRKAIDVALNRKNETEKSPVPIMCLREMGAGLPCFSVKLVETVSGFGFQPNVDNWAISIAVALRDLFEVNVWHSIGEYWRRFGAGLDFQDRRQKKSFNNMIVGHSSLTNNVGYSENPYYYNLLLQQVKNIFLNVAFKQCAESDGVSTVGCLKNLSELCIDNIKTQGSNSI